jgi:hypothetical protein
MLERFTFSDGVQAAYTPQRETRAHQTEPIGSARQARAKRAQPSHAYATTASTTASW